jgi:hypothetical protein
MLSVSIRRDTAAAKSRDSQDIEVGNGPDMGSLATI